MPPCAATVCERVGKDLGDAGGLQPGLGGAERGAQARAAGADHDHVEQVLRHRIGAAVHRRRLAVARCPFAAISASEGDLEDREDGDQPHAPAEQPVAR